MRHSLTPQFWLLWLWLSRSTFSSAFLFLRPQSVYCRPSWWIPILRTALQPCAFGTRDRILTFQETAGGAGRPHFLIFSLSLSTREGRAKALSRKNYPWRCVSIAVVARFLTTKTLGKRGQPELRDFLYNRAHAAAKPMRAARTALPHHTARRGSPRSFLRRPGSEHLSVTLRRISMTQRSAFWATA